MFNEYRFKKSDRYKAVEQEIIDIIGAEEYKRYKKERRNERLRDGAIKVGTGAVVVAVIFAVGIKQGNKIIENYGDEIED